MAGSDERFERRLDLGSYAVVGAFIAFLLILVATRTIASTAFLGCLAVILLLVATVRLVLRRRSEHCS